MYTILSLILNYNNISLLFKYAYLVPCMYVSCNFTYIYLDMNHGIYFDIKN